MKAKNMPTRTKLTKHKLENKTKVRCQLGNKAIKIKLNKYVEKKGEKEKKERIDTQS